MPDEKLAEYVGGIEDLLRRVRGAFYNTFRKPDTSAVAEAPSDFWVKDMFSQHPDLGDAVVVEDRGMLWAVSYEIDEAGKIAFASRDEWEMVIPTYIKVKSVEEADTSELDFAESASGFVIGLAEAQLPQDGNRAPVELDMKIIAPGAGNKHDNHWYPADMLRRDANVFEGVDVFVTDHREDERSERTKVGKIKGIEGFADDGGPIGRLVIYDPDLAEKTRNRATAGELETLHCSILAHGTAKKGEIDGQEYHIVEAISHASAVDLVSRAGAGGKALALAESEDGGGLMEDNETEMAEDKEQESEDATFQEQEEEPVAPPVPENLSPEEVAEALGAVNLPDVSIAKLQEMEYPDAEACQKAIATEVAYIKELTGSGSPFDQGASQSQEPKTLTEDEKTARFNEHMRAIGAREV